MMRYNVFVLFALVAVANSRFISFEDCSYSRSSNSTDKCDKDCIIHSVELFQCEGPDDKDYETCHVTHNYIVNIIVNYTAHLCKKLNARMFWNRPPNETVILAMNQAACLSKNCNVERLGESQTYFAQISMYKQYPAQPIDYMRWTLFDNSVQHSQCCVQFPIEVYG